MKSQSQMSHLSLHWNEVLTQLLYCQSPECAFHINFYALVLKVKTLNQKLFWKLKAVNFPISSLGLDIFLIARLERALGLSAQLMWQLSNFCIRSLAQKPGLFPHPSPAAALPACPGSSAGHALCPAGMAHPRGIRKNREHPDSRAAAQQWASKCVLNLKPFPCFLCPCCCTCCA